MKLKVRGSSEGRNFDTFVELMGVIQRSRGNSHRAWFTRLGYPAEEHTDMLLWE